MHQPQDAEFDDEYSDEEDNFEDEDDIDDEGVKIFKKHN